MRRPSMKCLRVMPQRLQVECEKRSAQSKSNQEIAEQRKGCECVVDEEIDFGEG